MQAINIYTLTRIDVDEKGTYSNYENILSQREEALTIKDYEFESLKELVDELVKHDIDVVQLDGFFFSYKMKHIGKEFDLLKISKNKIVLNIELKSESVSKEKIEKQLRRNMYYLEHLAPRMYLFTFVKDTKELFMLENGNMQKCSMQDLVNAINEFNDYIAKDIDDLFCAKDFLISPLNSPERFLSEKYFLTQQQEDIEKKILSFLINRNGNLLYGIKGHAGTGKTLLLYDLAKKCCQYGKCCMIHCGIICEGHNYLNAHLYRMDIIAAKDLKEEILGDYQFIFVDETQRIYYEDLDTILKTSYQKKIPCVFSYDFTQVLSNKEKNRNIPLVLNSKSNFNEFELSVRIRVNKEITYFIASMLNLKEASKIKYRYSNIELLYANNFKEAVKIISYYRDNKNYVFIGYTQSRYYSNSIDHYGGDINTHHVIGQEFDNVMIMMDNNFQYGEDGDLQAIQHPNPDYLFPKLFYQAVTRAREKLCILVVENKELFEKINAIQYRCINSY